MDKDRIKGSVETAKGSMKEFVGKVTGDAKLEAEGRKKKPPAEFRTRSAGSRTQSARPQRNSRRSPPTSSQGWSGGWRYQIAERPAKGDTLMDMTTLLIIVVIVLLIGGGGFYGRGRWY